MADLMARSLLAEWDPDRQLIQVESVGVRAQVGAPIPAAAQRVLADLGMPAGNHRARWMSADIVFSADLVLTMGAVQREAALALNPRALRSTFTLLEAARLVESLDVAAPLAPDASRHARAVVSEMATARRFRSAAQGSDDLPDLVSEADAEIRALAGQALAAVKTVLQALVLPEFDLRTAQATLAITTATAELTPSRRWVSDRRSQTA